MARKSEAQKLADHLMGTGFKAKAKAAGRLIKALRRGEAMVEPEPITDVLYKRVRDNLPGVLREIEGRAVVRVTKGRGMKLDKDQLIDRAKYARGEVNARMWSFYMRLTPEQQAEFAPKFLASIQEIYGEREGGIVFDRAYKDASKLLTVSMLSYAKDIMLSDFDITTVDNFKTTLGHLIQMKLLGVIEQTVSETSRDKLVKYDFTPKDAGSLNYELYHMAQLALLMNIHQQISMKDLQQFHDMGALIKGQMMTEDLETGDAKEVVPEEKKMSKLSAFKTFMKFLKDWVKSKFKKAAKEVAEVAAEAGDVKVAKVAAKIAKATTPDLPMPQLMVHESTTAIQTAAISAASGVVMKGGEVPMQQIVDAVVKKLEVGELVEEIRTK